MHDDSTSTKIIRCDDCSRRPYKRDGELVFPDEICPCRFENIYPPDNYFCGHGEYADTQKGARIEFRPVCSKCHSIIFERISYDDDGPDKDGYPVLWLSDSRISPVRCPVCKTRFDSIVAPTRLPFEGYE